MRIVVLGLFAVALLGGCSQKEIKQTSGEIADDIKSVIKGR